jgi:hypothetical protein
MAGTRVTEYELYWLHEVNPFHSEYKEIVAEYQDAAPVIEQVHKICDIVSLAGCITSNVGKGEEWKSIVESAEQDRRQLCDTLRGKFLFSALYGTYTVTLSNLKSVLKTSASQKQKAATTEKTPEESDDGFRKQRRRKRNSATNTDTQQRDKKKAREKQLCRRQHRV